MEINSDMFVTLSYCKKVNGVAKTRCRPHPVRRFVSGLAVWRNQETHIIWEHFLLHVCPWLWTIYRLSSSGARVSTQTSFTTFHIDKKCHLLSLSQFKCSLHRSPLSLTSAGCTSNRFLFFGQLHSETNHILPLYF